MDVIHTRPVTILLTKLTFVLNRVNDVDSITNEKAESLCDIF